MDEKKHHTHIEKITSQVASEIEEELPEFEDVDDGGGFMDTVRQIMRASGLHGRTLIGCGVVVLVIAGVMAFFMIGGWDTIKSFIPFRDAKPPIITSIRPADITNSDLLMSHLFGAYPIGHAGYPPSQEVAYMYGGLLPTQFFRLSTTQTGLHVAYRYGFRGYTHERLEAYIETVRRIQSALLTDISAVLNQSGNRRSALDALIRDFDALYEQSQEHSALVVKEVLTLRTQTGPAQDLKKNFEQEFNRNLAVFLPRESRRSLEEFIRVGKEEVELRAHLGAFTQLDKYYQVALVKLAARIKDIKANYEALAKGVKAFDILNSDIDIIKYEGDAPRNNISSPLNRSTSEFFTPVDFFGSIR